MDPELSGLHNVTIMLHSAKLRVCSMFYSVFVRETFDLFYIFVISCAKSTKGMHSTYLKNGEKNGAKTLRVNHYLQAGTMQIKFYTNRCCCRRSPCGSQHSGASG